jgi:hypothetical protein
MRISRLRPFSGLASAVLLVASVTALQTPALAGSASIAIDHVGGRTVVNGQVSGQLRGKALVTGAAVPGAAMPPAPVAKPLTADAGDSGFVSSGDTVTLLGTGYNGTAPYRFAWTTTAGRLVGADAATAQVDTTGITPGTYTAGLTITDATGASASDTVKFVVYQGPLTLLDVTQVDSTPGALGTTALTIPFTVPAGASRLVVRGSWSATSDYDMHLTDPSGKDVPGPGSGIGVAESIAVDAPAAGSWKALLDRFTTVGDTVHVTAVATVPSADPRPVVSAGGPYRFALGAAQPISGTATGAAPLAIGWDTNEDGILDTNGLSFSGAFSEGHRLVTLKATDANGLERRETTSVLVARPDRLAVVTTPITVIGINDSGLNPYHFEFSAQTYPDPDVLALTKNFTRHPSEYIPGYPKDAAAIPITLGQGYWPAKDAGIWDLKDATHPTGLEYGKLYWIPGTKIIGATQPAALSCSNCEAGAHVILDDDGHGSGSSSVSVGNRYGYCPTCLLVIEKGLNAGPAAGYSWIDIQSNSWGAIANVPLDLVFSNNAKVTKAAAERGQTILFASGNGAANAFDAPISTYGTANTGPDWNVVVGAIRRDNQRAIVGDGTPSHLSSWGDGNLPSACRTGTVSQCAFGGTSAATPYTAGVFGNVLTEVRRVIGDNSVGQRPGQVAAQGVAVPNSPYLADGKLTRAELREAVFKTAFPLNQDNAQTIPIYPYPLTAPYQGDINVLFEGYGAATPNSAKRAVDVLTGKMPLPVREAEDRFFAIDRQIRDTIWGGYDRDGDGVTDSYAIAGKSIKASDVQTADQGILQIRKVTDELSAASLALTGSNPLTYWLHRASRPDAGGTLGCNDAELYMDQNDSAGDFEPCFENRVTSVLAAYRPLGIWPTPTDSTIALPAGSTVNVELYLATDMVTAPRPTGVLMASDRVLGTGSGTPTPTIGSGPYVSQGSPVGLPAPLPSGVAIDANKCATLGEVCWTKLAWSFQTTRPSIPGEQLTFQVQLLGARAYAFGYEGQHRSKISITPAATPASGTAFNAQFTDPGEGAKLPEGAFSVFGTAAFPNLGTTPAGDHPVIKRVDVSVDDASFANPIQASLDEASNTWSAPIPKLAVGAHTLYARAALDRNTSPASTLHLTVQSAAAAPRVEWQVVPLGATPSATGWQPAAGVLSYSFVVNTATYPAGRYTIYSRLLEDGAQTAITSVNARFAGR